MREFMIPYITYINVYIVDSMDVNECIHVRMNEGMYAYMYGKAGGLNT
jgi:hypothetical protein